MYKKDGYMNRWIDRCIKIKKDKMKHKWID